MNIIKLIFWTKTQAGARKNLSLFGKITELQIVFEIEKEVSKQIKSFYSLKN
jgi:hypothetical protein